MSYMLGPSFAMTEIELYKTRTTAIKMFTKSTMVRRSRSGIPKISLAVSVRKAYAAYRREMIRNNILVVKGNGAGSIPAVAAFTSASILAVVVFSIRSQIASISDAWGSSEASPCTLADINLV